MGIYIYYTHTHICVYVVWVYNRNKNGFKPLNKKVSSFLLILLISLTGIFRNSILSLTVTYLSLVSIKYN